MPKKTLGLGLALVTLAIVLWIPASSTLADAGSDTATTVRQAPNPLPTNHILVPYGPNGFANRADCQSYLDGENKGLPYPGSVVADARAKCCNTGSNAKEFDSQGPRTGLSCRGDGASFECNGARCNALGDEGPSCGSRGEQLVSR